MTISRLLTGFLILEVVALIAACAEVPAAKTGEQGEPITQGDPLLSISPTPGRTELKLSGPTSIALPQIPESQSASIKFQLEGTGNVWVLSGKTWTELGSNGAFSLTGSRLLFVDPQIGQTVSFILDFIFPGPPCDRPILRTGSDYTVSDFHNSEEPARTQARNRVQGKANTLAAADASSFACPSVCPTPKGSSASADITSVNAYYGPPEFQASVSKWWAHADFNWFATVVCQ